MPPFIDTLTPALDRAAAPIMVPFGPSLGCSALGSHHLSCMSLECPCGINQRGAPVAVLQEAEGGNGLSSLSLTLSLIQPLLILPSSFLFSSPEHTFEPERNIS